MPENKFFEKTKSNFAGKIALITDTYFAVNGVSRTYQELAIYCRRKNIQLDIFTLGRKENHQKKGTVNIYQLASVWPVKYYYDLPPFDARIISPGLKEKLTKGNYDLIHLATPGSLGIAARIIFAHQPIPKIGVFHTLLADYAQNWLTINLKKLSLTFLSPLGEMSQGLVWRFLKWFYAKTDLVLAPSREVQKKLKFLDRPLDLFPRGVDTKIFNPVWQNQRLKSKKPVALYVGRLSLEKNLDLLVEVWKNRKNVDLWLVGDGPYKTGLMKQLPQAKFWGYLTGKKLSQVYASADFFVFPSVTDTFGNAVLEAQASGLPVIVTDVGGPKELVKNKINGLIVKPNITAFTEAISQFIQHSDQRKIMGQNARNTALSRDWDKAFGQLIKIYQKMCEASLD
ncbi:MAG: hypothetical protein A2729_00645 [Candidatus Buchananbacteria bacterium RIFCSPHIGHO2_01_FULL_39_14]|uniref:Glycosyltransferase subfamily 4-like N-terminal domain-containing protein n=2 Tax=Candidatus Buchananiibacteriota TaxID=1817903 RepID=A0A1G1YQF9_9BACT|nr:MAG: hypothetical protein A2729_00645 [Candidatus Buchananbacteria bacterium RIFCSPHIGHO2_01_FULL_39_14]OGY48696.1 MAG: hypothetical protein A3D39_04460 [Candidatus Buchananbacteria bacterium RIFCSPHIGHO2_02_FULL_39_17]OGY54529.1 MAG: hypothetical protein A2912_00255 [Candidatus Buchananbacteria bacterium RIFCSPLOWO2_01_FULL_40_23b]